MNNALVALQQGAVALVDDAATKAMAESISGGLTSGAMFGNRISLKGSRFHFIKGGVDVGALKGEHLDVVMLAANPHVSRIFFAGQYDAATKAAPDCYSLDGKAPPLDVPNRQSDKCMTCPQNAKGSATRGNTKAKACAYKKRVIVAAPDAIDGDIYALDVNALSLFGDDRTAQNLFNLKSYIETLSAHQMLAVKLVTRLTFDEASSVPKVFFSPIRMLTPEEWEQSKARMQDEAIQQMLADVINDAEVGTVAPEKVLNAPAAAQNQAPAAPTIQAPVPAAQPVAAAPEAPKRGRPRGTTAAPSNGAGAAPPNTAAAAQAVTNTVRGFAPEPDQPTSGTPASPAPTPAATGTPKGFTIDLDKFDD